MCKVRFSINRIARTATKKKEMEWMRGFKADELESMSEEEKVAYLKDEKVKIQKVNQDIKNVLGIEEK